MWTKENRVDYKRDELRYPRDLTDAEWAFVAPLIPAAKRGGNKRTHAWPIAPNHLEQNFLATRPDEKWGADKTLKSEMIWRSVFYTRQQAEIAITRYIDGF
jgi:hypothetical protein